MPPWKKKTKDEKYVFYEQLEELYNKVKGDTVRIILGDLNAKVGNKKMDMHVTGGESKHEERQRQLYKTHEIRRKKNN